MYEQLLSDSLCSRHPKEASFPEASSMMLGWLFFEGYAIAYSRCLQDRFFADFRDAQATHVAVGGTFFPLQDVRALDGCLLLYEWHDASFNASRGVMAGVVVEHDLLQKISGAFQGFLDSFSMTRRLAGRLSSTVGQDPLLRTFAGVLVTAREQAQAERTEIAFLLCCTALECMLVSGQGEPISRALGRRLGAVESLSSNLPFQSTAREIQQLYDTRSQFAHRASPIEPEALERIFSLCQSAYIAAAAGSIRLSASEEPNWVKSWHVALDYVAAALAAGVPIDADAAAKAGINLSSGAAEA